MTPEEKSLTIRLLELKFRIKTLIREWEDNARVISPRFGKAYKLCATELFEVISTFEEQEHKIRHHEVSE